MYGFDKASLDTAAATKRLAVESLFAHQVKNAKNAKIFTNF